jgi:hypothetical protein
MHAKHAHERIKHALSAWGDQQQVGSGVAAQGQELHVPWASPVQHNITASAPCHVLSLQRFQHAGPS